MASSLEITDIQLLNYVVLHIVQREIERDPAQACYSFRLPVTAVQPVRQLSEADMSQLVTSWGRQCMFQLRPDLLACAEMPAELRAVLSAARNPHAGEPVSRYDVATSVVS